MQVHGLSTVPSSCNEQNYPIILNVAIQKGLKAIPIISLRLVMKNPNKTNLMLTIMKMMMVDTVQ